MRLCLKRWLFSIQESAWTDESLFRYLKRYLILRWICFALLFSLFFQSWNFLKHSNIPFCHRNGERHLNCNTHMYWQHSLTAFLVCFFLFQAQFFQSHQHYKHLDKNRRGIRNLATKMTKVLIEKIKETLPDLRQQVGFWPSLWPRK